MAKENWIIKTGKCSSNLSQGIADPFFSGWITGHSYGAYGPLLCGATSVLYEG